MNKTMNKGVQTRSFFALCACCALALLGASAPAYAGSDVTYHTILDFTQGGSVNVVVTNTQSTNKARTYPYIGVSNDPYAAVNPGYYPPGYTPPTPDLYVKVDVLNSTIRQNSLSTANFNTCNQSDPTQCPGSGTLPTTYVHRLGTYKNGSVTALNNSTLKNGVETLNNLFQQKTQAFDVDRIRYAANRLWYTWRQDVLNNTGWAKLFNYQPTGTMSFENFINNIVHGYPMYGIVRVVIPVNNDSSTGTVGDMFLDPKQPVEGDEFTSSYTKADWQNDAQGTNSSSPVMVNYEAMWPGTSVPSTVTKTSDRYPYSGTMTIYGMLLVDYVDRTTYDPDHFFDKSQDYIDNYSDQATHDAQASNLTGISNFILPRSSGRNIVLMDWDTLNINPIDDLQTQVQYGVDTAIPNQSDGRADTLDIARRKYMMNNSVAFQVSEISDDYVYEWWMRDAASLPLTDSTRTQIITDLTGNPPGNTVGGGTAQFDFKNQVFNAGASRLTDFDNTIWADPNLMPEQNKFHAYFPSGYERGWMIAFDSLHMADLDATTTEQTPGSWWMHLTDAAAGTDGVTISKSFAEFSVPAVPAEWITLDANGDGTATPMPNFFTTDWEDFPALAFSGGLLDIHGFANISGMLYTPDSCEIEAHPGSEIPGGASDAGPFQYVNGALLVGNGLWLEDQKTSDHSMIAISYNYNSFDRLRSAAAYVDITKATNISELQGQ